MGNTTQIKKENIRKKVISEIKKAKKEVLATMDIAEELASPLPVEYFSLLEKKHKQGIQIKRVIFGSTKEYKYFLKQIRDKNLFFTGRHTNSKNYKRMIIIDDTRLFFRKKVKNKTIFYFTTHDEYLKEYKRYFNRFR